MDARLDHIVLWVADPLRSVDFYTRVVGLTAERVEEFRARRAPFPSVRVSPDSLIDLMAREIATVFNAMPGGEDSAGHPVHYVCIALDRGDYAALRTRLEAHGVATPAVMTHSFGARGLAPEAVYFRDPDGNIIEARYYA
jgi:catechol 2,3-dioxygenase-like lactoylglutathione lyase family enzyme